MSRPNSHVIRAALAISGKLSSDMSVVTIDDPLVLAEWEYFRAAQRRLIRAEVHGWRLAADRCKRQLIETRKKLANRLSHYHRWEAQPCLATPSDLILDLIALEAEFDEVAIDLRGRVVSVTMPPVELVSEEGETIDLGRFQITLSWLRIGECDQPYKVTALDPNPASSSDTTHPHLAGDVLCEGEGRAAIRSALSTGRLFDFFLLVRQILSTYNPSSAYCELERWQGFTCADCGDWMQDQERYGCDGCGSNLCRDCLEDCPACSHFVCSECRDRCAECGEAYCNRCFRKIADQQDRCEACHESLTQQPPQTEGVSDAEASQAKAPATITAASQTTTQPVCMD